MTDFFSNHLDSILAYIFGAGGLFTAWTEKKKRKTDALSGMQLAYDKFIEDYDKKFEEMRSEVAMLKNTHQEEISKLQSKLEKVEASWRQKYNALKTAFDNYKKTHP